MEINSLTLSNILPVEWGTPTFEPFEACASYSAPMDSITYLQEDESTRADRIDHFLTILWHPQDDRVIGLKIKGIQFLFETLQTAVRSVTGKDIPDDGFIPLVGALELALKMHAGAPLSEKAQKARSDEWSSLMRGYELARGIATGVTFDVGQLRSVGS